MSTKLWLAAAACVLLLAPQARAGVFMMIETAKAGSFQGSSKVKGREGWIVLLSVEAPKAGGDKKNKKEHGPVKVTKKVGELSKELKAALDGKATLSKVTIREERDEKGGSKRSGEGEPHPVVTIVLFNAVISKIEVSSDAKQKAKKAEEKETIEFSYQKIEITRESGTKSSGDAWGAPAQ